jgi:hypothetical protein
MLPSLLSSLSLSGLGFRMVRILGFSESVDMLLQRSSIWGLGVVSDMDRLAPAAPGVEDGGMDGRARCISTGDLVMLLARSSDDRLNGSAMSLIPGVDGAEGTSGMAGCREYGSKGLPPG